MNDMGRFEDGVVAHHARPRARPLLSRKRRQRAGAGEGRQRRRPARGLQQLRHPVRRCRRVLSRGRLRTAPEEGRVQAHRPDSEPSRLARSCRSATPRSRARASRCSRWPGATELEALVRRVEHCRLETHPDFFDFFVEGCQFKPVRVGRSGDRMIELVDTCPDVNVQPAEYKRLLGYPRDWVVRDRARELVDWARALVRATRPAVGVRSRGRHAARSPTTTSRLNGVAVHEHAAVEDAARALARTARSSSRSAPGRSSRPKLRSSGGRKSRTSTSSSKSTAPPSSSTWSR